MDDDMPHARSFEQTSATCELFSRLVGFHTIINNTNSGEEKAGLRETC